MHRIGFSQTAGEAGHPGSLPHPRGDRATCWLWTTEGVPGLSVCSRGGQDVAGDPEVCVCVGGGQVQLTVLSFSSLMHPEHGG